MSRKIIFSLAILLFSTLITFPSWGTDNRYRIAVLPFDDGSVRSQWSQWEVGRGVSDELVNALMQTGNFRLIEREQLDRVIREQNLGESGRIDNATIARVGKILGVQFLVTGRVTEFATSSQGGGALFNTGVGIRIKETTARVTIEARLVDSTTAEITAAVSGHGEKKNTNVGLVANWNSIAFGSNEFRKTILGQALNDAVNSLAKQLSDQAYQGGPPPSQLNALSGLVADFTGDRVYINLGSRDGVQPGMIFVVQHVIRLIRDPKTGEVIDQATEPVAVLSVTEVREKASTCVISSRLNSNYEIKVGDLIQQKTQ